MRKPAAVITSDIHFNLNTLKKAGLTLAACISTAKDLEVPLIIAGDLLDQKAIIRAECINVLLDELVPRSVRTLILVGNHSLVNERGTEHALNFLRPYAEVIDKLFFDKKTGYWFIPYQTDKEVLRELLKQIPPNSTIIGHQGILGSKMGHYVLDKSSIEPEAFAGHRVLLGHYHERQDIKNTRISYLGSPFTQTFSEALQGPKGFNILYSDGSLELVPLNLPKHVVVERTTSTVYDPIEGLGPRDHLLMKVTGTDEELRLLNKHEIGTRHLGHANFRLDLIPTEIEKATKEVATELTESELLDNLIDALDGTQEYKSDLKNTWRELVK